MGVSQKIQWYRHRLASMSIPEIIHRVQEQVKRKHDRYCPPQVSNKLSDAPLLLMPELRERLDGWNVPQALLAEWEEHVAQARTGEFFLLGQRWPGDASERKWHLDPVRGKSWPADRYCFDIDFRHAPEMGDIKYVWELGRLQHLQPIAALAFKRKDATLAVFAIAELESWIDHNPPYLGVHWASGIELALRAVSILVIATLVADYLPTRMRVKIKCTLEAHGLWLARYPSKYSSANNHLVAEGLGLLAIGALCPELKEAVYWKKHGWEILCEAAEKQILPDGVGAEQTITYTAVVLEMLLLGLHLARAAGLEVPEHYMQRVILGGEYLRWFTDEGGNQPRIGDDDNARVIGVYRRDEHYALSVLGCLAAFSKRDDLTPPHVHDHLRNALFGFPPAASRRPEGVKIFSDGGYTVGRHHVNGRHMLLAIDHGPLGYLSIAAHGHADALAVWLHVDDQPILVDSGTYLYHSGGIWRDYFRGTAAHNTLRLERADSSIMSGNFNWRQKAHATLVGQDVAGESWSVEAKHDGYQKRFGAVHHRRLQVTPVSGFVIEDWLVASKSHFAEIGFLLHPALHAVMQGDAITICKGERCLVRVRHESGLTAAIHPALSEKGGWYSPTFGEKEAAARIVFSGMLAPEQKAITHFTFSDKP